MISTEVSKDVFPNLEDGGFVWVQDGDSTSRRRARAHVTLRANRLKEDANKSKQRKKNVQTKAQERMQSESEEDATNLPYQTQLLMRDLSLKTTWTCLWKTSSLLCLCGESLA